MNIQILSDAEFDSLPYPEVEVSLGIADPDINTAYVRQTHMPELTQYLVNHEIEHLIEGHGGKHSDHYRNGVYYKGFGQLLPTIVSLFSDVGGMVLKSREASKQAKQQNSMMQQSQFSQPPTSFAPTQTGFGAPSTPTGAGAGASGGTGALGGNLTGSPVDKIRPLVDEGSQGNQGNFQKGFYAGRLG